MKGWALTAFCIFGLVGARAFADQKREFIRPEKSRAPRSLALKMPILDTDSVTCPPFDVTAKIKASAGGHQLAVRFQRPGRVDVVGTDAADGSPYLVSIDRHLLTFDPIKPQMISIQDVKWFWSLKGIEGNCVQVDFRFDTAKSFQQRVFVDVPAMLLAEEGELIDHDSTDSLVCLEHLSANGKSLKVELNQAVAEPTCTIRLLDKGEVEPTLAICLVMHVHPQRPLAKIPDLDRLGEVVPLDRFDGAGDLDMMLETATKVWKGLYGHFGTWSPAMREDGMFPKDASVDWNAVAARKKRSGILLRSLFSLPTPDRSDNDATLTPVLAADEAETVK